MVFRRPDVTAAAALGGAVVVLDLLWSAFVGSTGRLAYGFFDEPAHLATCAIALLALAAFARVPLPRRFAIAALVSSIAIDIDHIPAYLGSSALTGSLPRPYSHSLFLVAVVAGIGLLARRVEVRQISWGVAFGIAAHLLRDLATGPGVPLFTPVSNSVATIPYAVFAGALAVAVMGLAIRRAGPWGLRLSIGVGAGLVAFCLGVGATPAHAAPARDAIGVYLPNAEEDPSLIDRYASSIGRQPAIVSLYRDWSTPLMNWEILEAISTRGAIPMITWEPWRNWSQGVSLRSIAEGTEDPYIASAAREAAVWGRPIFLRFAHEMNGGWYPWGRVAGNTPALYRTAWRHIVELFRRLGARNVRWVWTPYLEGEHQHPFRRYYPGDKWVDWAGLDGFNWGPRFVSFGKLFQSSYDTLVGMTAKPLIVAETGSAEYGGYKAEWIREALGRALPRYKRIRALVWWNGVQAGRGTDLRLETSPDAFAAWTEALQAPRLTEGSKFLLRRPAWLRSR